ncbi:kinase domain-containing protein [Hyaloscypha bicolor E]|uniref:non-specific serine/threonine protein kinase n=1 Tax=Hyaloscypha bicolor E TaxID=1095630 RepID=A0A2J6TVB8_9HELO|nr:kinase domain-containing protein [Hyaloscypha bicolor E]PMD66931.1 kinase domain-containing protein [Hyaloscypha bicolor E]
MFKFSSMMTEDANLYHLGGLHPVNIGDRLKDERYQILHKLGFGHFSTVWLARDHFKACYVALKIYAAEEGGRSHSSSNELKALRHLSRGSETHPGRQFIMMLQDEFFIKGPNGTHQCCVTQVAGARLSRAPTLKYNALGPARKLASQLFLALEYIHSSEIVHGDIFTSNILQQVGIFDHWSEEELYECIGTPIREKVDLIDQTEPIGTATPTYLVHQCNLAALEECLALPKIILIDFGSAFSSFKPPIEHDNLPQISPTEVLFHTTLSSSIDTWAAGCVTFEICAGYTLFKALFNRKQDVRKDIVAMLGKPPKPMWQLRPERGCYFEADGTPKKTAKGIMVKPYPLSDRIRDMTRLYSDTEDFPTAELAELYDLLSKIFLYETESRLSPSMALKHPFLSHYV